MESGERIGQGFGNALGFLVDLFTGAGDDRAKIRAAQTRLKLGEVPESAVTPDVLAAIENANRPPLVRAAHGLAGMFGMGGERAAPRPLETATTAYPRALGKATAADARNIADVLGNPEMTPGELAAVMKNVDLTGQVLEQRGFPKAMDRYRTAVEAGADPNSAWLEAIGSLSAEPVKTAAVIEKERTKSRERRAEKDYEYDRREQLEEEKARDRAALARERIDAQREIADKRLKIEDRRDRRGRRKDRRAEAQGRMRLLLQERGQVAQQASEGDEDAKGRLKALDQEIRTLRSGGRGARGPAIQNPNDYVYVEDEKGNRGYMERTDPELRSGKYKIVPR